MGGKEKRETVLSCNHVQNQERHWPRKKKKVNQNVKKSKKSGRSSSLIKLVNWSNRTLPRKRSMAKKIAKVREGSNTATAEKKKPKSKGRVGSIKGAGSAVDYAVIFKKPETECRAELVLTRRRIPPIKDLKKIKPGRKNAGTVLWQRKWV